MFTLDSNANLNLVTGEIRMTPMVPLHDLATFIPSGAVR